MHLTGDVRFALLVRQAWTSWFLGDSSQQLRLQPYSFSPQNKIKKIEFSISNSDTMFDESMKRAQINLTQPKFPLFCLSCFLHFLRCSIILSLIFFSFPIFYLKKKKKKIHFLLFLTFFYLSMSKY